MNRRKLLAFLGIGSVGAIIPRVWAQKPMRPIIPLTKVDFDKRVVEKIASIQGISEWQASLLKIKTFGPFLKKSTITPADAQDILDSISIQKAIAEEEIFRKDIRESATKNLAQIANDMIKRKR